MNFAVIVFVVLAVGSAVARSPVPREYNENDYHITTQSFGGDGSLTFDQGYVSPSTIGQQIRPHLSNLSPEMVDLISQLISSHINGNNNDYSPSYDYYPGDYQIIDPGFYRPVMPMLARSQRRKPEKPEEKHDAVVVADSDGDSDAAVDSAPLNLIVDPAFGRPTLPHVPTRPHRPSLASIRRKILAVINKLISSLGDKDDSDDIDPGFGPMIPRPYLREQVSDPKPEEKHDDASLPILNPIGPILLDPGFARPSILPHLLTRPQRPDLGLLRKKILDLIDNLISSWKNGHDGGAVSAHEDSHVQVEPVKVAEPVKVVDLPPTHVDPVKVVEDSAPASSVSVVDSAPQVDPVSVVDSAPDAVQVVDIAKPVVCPPRPSRPSPAQLRKNILELINKLVSSLGDNDDSAPGPARPSLAHILRPHLLRPSKPVDAPKPDGGAVSVVDSAPVDSKPEPVSVVEVAPPAPQPEPVSVVGPPVSQPEAVSVVQTAHVESNSQPGGVSVVASAPAESQVSAVSVVDSAPADSHVQPDINPTFVRPLMMPPNSMDAMARPMMPPQGRSSFGLDQSFLRPNFNRPSKPNNNWGPEDNRDDYSVMDGSDYSDNMYDPGFARPMFPQMLTRPNYGGAQPLVQILN